MEKNMEFIVLTIICFFIFMIGLFIALYDSPKDTSTDTGKYCGPVQEGYDEQLFRETGKYKKIEVIKDGS